MSHETPLDPIARFLHETFVSRLRHDLKAFYFPPAAGQAKGGYRPERSPVTLDDLRRHLTGEQPIGLYVMAPETDGVVRAAVVDLDDKEKKLSWAELCVEASEISQRLEELGLLPWACRSGSGHGIHLWLIWQEPQPAGATRKLLRKIVEDAAGKAHVDIYPAQDKLAGSMGNLVALPFGRASRPIWLDGTVVQDLETWLPTTPAYSQGVPAGALSPDELQADAGKGLGGMEPEVFGPVDPAQLADALSSVDASAYETWVRFGLAIKLAVNNDQLTDEQGFHAWDTWSRTAGDKYDERVNRTTWDRHLKARDGGVTLGTVWHEAKEAGWKPKSPRTIEMELKIEKHAEAMVELKSLSMAGRMTSLIPENEEPDDLLMEEMAWLTKKGDPEVEKINKKHFIAQDGGKVHLFREDVDEVLNRRRLSRLGIHDFKVYYQNRPVMVGLRKNTAIYKPLGDVWLDSPFRRQYREIVLKPEGCRPWQYNLWKGWTCEESEQGSWDLLNHHIQVNICRRDAVAYEYVMNWCALTIQRPEYPIGVALVLRGNRGTGKSSFIRAIGELFGQHFVHITNSRALTGNFNSHLRDCLMLFADEAVWSGNYSDESILKGYITEPTITIEGKGRDAVICRNMMHIAIATNRGWAVPVGLDERRFCCLNVSDEHQKDSSYFKGIQRQLQNGGSARLLWDLKRRDISQFNPQNVPSTDELTEQKVETMEMHHHWWLEKLRTGQICPGYEGWEESIPATVIYNDYAEMCKKSGNVGVTGAIEHLSQRLKELLPRSIISERQRVVLEGIRQKAICWKFPPLRDCQEFFNKKSGCKFIWPVDPIDDPELGRLGDRFGQNDDGTLNF